MKSAGRKTWIFFGACAAGCVLLIALLTHGTGPAVCAGLGVTSDALAIRSSLFTAYLTNLSDADIVLLPPIVERQDSSSRNWDDVRGHWAYEAGGLAFADTLSPDKVAVISIGAGGAGIKRVRLIAKFGYAASPLTRAVSHIVAMLPVSHLPRTARNWLGNHGFVDGRLEGKLEGDWVENPGFDPLATGGLNGGAAYYRFNLPPPKKATNSF